MSIKVLGPREPSKPRATLDEGGIMNRMNTTSERLPAFAGMSAAILICALAVSSCGTAAPNNKASSTASTSPGSTIDDSFDVGGHKLHLQCQGSGSPTVVYLHGFISDPSGGGAQNSGDIPGLLAEHRRVCIYDRANVGLSDSVDGPLTGKDSVHDLRALLAAAKVPGPYVLLGASFGGLIADMYASTYPDDVVGMVLLDASLPQDTNIDDRFVPKAERLQPDEWKTTTEQINQLKTYHQAQAIEGNEPKVPVTYIGTTQVDLPPSFPVKAMSAAIRAGQRAFVDRFSPGRLILLDVPHYMEPVIPERIAQEVERVIKAGRAG